MRKITINIREDCPDTCIYKMVLYGSTKQYVCALYRKPKGYNLYNLSERGYFMTVMTRRVTCPFCKIEEE